MMPQSVAKELITVFRKEKVLIEETLIETERAVKKLFYDMGGTQATPQARRDNATKKFKEVQQLLDLRNRYSELGDFFAKLEASRDKAKIREVRFKA